MKLPLTLTELSQALPRAVVELPRPVGIAGQCWEAAVPGGRSLGFTAQSGDGAAQNGSNGLFESSRGPHFQICGGGGRYGKLEIHSLIEMQTAEQKTGWNNRARR